MRYPYCLPPTLVSHEPSPTGGVLLTFETRRYSSWRNTTRVTPYRWSVEAAERPSEPASTLFWLDHMDQVPKHLRGLL